MPLLEALPSSLWLNPGSHAALEFRTGSGAQTFAGLGLQTKAGSTNCIFERVQEKPSSFRLRPWSIVDTYDVTVLNPTVDTTSVAVPFDGCNYVVSDPALPWIQWLPEVRPNAVPELGDRTVGRQIEQIQQITGLSDGQLAAAFGAGITRETVNRWRNRLYARPKPENLYRLGALHDLALRMEDAGIDSSTWLHQPIEGGGPSPFALLCGGRLGDVRRAVDLVAIHLARPRDSALVIGADRTPDAAVPEDDEGEWIWSEGTGESET